MSNEDIRTRLLASCATIDETTDQAVVDFGELVMRLLLFDTYVLDSHRLREFPHLVEAFGVSGVLSLLKSGALAISCEPLTIAQLGQYENGRLRRNKPILPLGSFSFGWVGMTYREKYIHDAMRPLHQLGLPEKQVKKLKHEMADHLVPPLTGAGDEALRELQRDLANGVPSAKTGVSIALSRRLGKQVGPSQFAFRLDEVSDGDFRAESDIENRFALDPEEAHDAVARGLLAVGGLNVTLQKMRRMHALSGFKEGELPLFEDKLSFFTEGLDPDVSVKQFRRVVRIKDFPDLDAMAQLGAIDVERVLQIRQTKACAEFRSWLFSLDSATDEEIEERFRDFREQLAWFAHGGVGKVLRWLATSGAGLVPVAGVLLGPLASALDVFLVDRLLPQHGPTAFVNDLFPSIFVEPQARP